MVAFGAGPLAGKNMQAAADIVLSETGQLPHLPQLPERGLGADPIGRTAGLLESLAVDWGPRGWRLAARPQLLTRRVWDGWERDLDAVQEVWGEHVPRVKVQAVGPFTLAAALELSNGHRVITDRGAATDLTSALRAGLIEHCAAVARRFHAEVHVQIDEPLLPVILAGRLSGTTDFDTIPAIPAEVVLDTLQSFGAQYLHMEPCWEIAAAAPTVLTEFAALGTPGNLDGAGEHLEAGRRLAVKIPTGEARAAAIAIARFCTEMGHDRALISERIDVVPAAALPGWRDYQFVAAVADILERDAGDL